LGEVVLHDETGTLSFAGDPGSLAWAVLRVLKDPARAQRLAHRARERLYTDFNWARIADQTLAVYDRVWAEFLDSYWAEGTVWPVSPGAEERARELNLREKAESGGPIDLPRPKLTMDVHPPIADVLLDETDEDVED